MKRTLITLMLIVTISASSSVPSAQGNELLIWDKLQGRNPKGYVLLLRHSLAPGVGDPKNFRLGDCSTQRNLSAEGREDAKEIGNWLSRRQIPIFRVESSRWCRAKETAQLLGLGKVKLNRNLDSLFQESQIATHPQTLNVSRQIVEHRNKEGLLILVGHYVNIAAVTGMGVDSGEGVLVRANRNGKIRVIGSTPDIS